MTLQLHFLGAAGTVTGSRTLLTDGTRRLLVDCGLFQGFKQLRLQNRAAFPVAPRSLDAVVLTHAHLDHSGYLPRLVAEGLHARVSCSPGTADLCGLLLPDSGFVMEEEAERANRYGYSRHQPATPLYTADEARASLRFLERIPVGEPHPLFDGVTVQLVRSGHIIGACSVLVDWRGVRVGFSGDLGRSNDPLLPAPRPLPEADWLVVESTYGDRAHADVDPEAQLGEIVRTTVARGGHVIVPAFAVGRTQRLLYHLWRLRQRGDIPDVPVWLNSPLAQGATDVFRAHAADHGLDTATVDAIGGFARYAQTRDESIALNHLGSPAILVAGSGMLTGGRVLHHLRAYGPDPRHSIVLTGFQAGGTRGEALIRGDRTLRLFGAEIEVAAEVHALHNLSAHADAAELLDWLRPSRPRRVFVNHGEPHASDALRARIERELGLSCTVPFHGERVDL